VETKTTTSICEDDSSWQTQTQRVEPAHRRVDAFYTVKPQLCSLCESSTTVTSEAPQQLDALLMILMAPVLVTA